MNRDQKVELASKLKEDLTNSELVIILHYRGLSDQALFSFRKDLKSKNAKLKIAKNTLVKVALKDTNLEILQDHLSGPTALVYANDPVELAKIVSDASKSNKLLDIKIGCLNSKILQKEQIEGLSKLGSLEEVRSKFAGLVNAGQLNFVRLLNATPLGLVSLLNNYSSKKEESKDI